MNIAAGYTETDQAASPPIPKRDFLLLPLISLLTIILPVIVCEPVARMIWSEMDDDTCAVSTEEAGFRHKPNCSNRMKIAEGPWIDYHYNECGYRGTEPCGPKPPGMARFAVIGTSVAAGMHVSESDYFATLLTPRLTGVLGRRAQFQNLGSIGPGISKEYLLKDEILGLHPDGVILVMVPYDLVRLDPPAQPQAGSTPPAPARRLPDFASFAKSSRMLFMAEHLVLQDEYYAARAFVVKNTADDASRITLSPLTRRRFEVMNSIIHRLAADFHSQGVPLMIIAFPNRLQSIAINHGTKGPGLDPEGFPRRIAAMARDAGAEFIDVVPALKRAPDVMAMFYTVDGHLTGQGNRLMAEATLEYFQSRKTDQIQTAAR